MSGSLYRYTSKEKSVYAIVLKWPSGSNLQLKHPKASKETTVTMLGLRKTLKWQSPSKGEGMEISLKDIGFDELPSTWAWAFQISNLENNN